MRRFFLAQFFLKEHKVAIYYLLVCIFLTSLVLGAIALQGKSPMKTYHTVGTLSDITRIEAYQSNGTLSSVQSNITMDKLILSVFPPASKVYLYIQQMVLDSKPNVLSLTISATGKGDFIYRLSVGKASFENGFSYVNIGRWVLASKSGTLTFTNLQIHRGLIVERAGNPDDDYIAIATTDSYGNLVNENAIELIEIERLAFVKEEEGREPHGQSIFLDFRFVLLSFNLFLILYPLPLILLKRKWSSLQLLLILGFLLRISIAPLTSHSFDIVGFKQAARTFYEEGNLTLFTNWSSPPFWFFTIIVFYAPYMLLRIVGLPDTRVYSQPVLSMEVTFLKFPLILSDILSTYLIYKICRKWNLDEGNSIKAAAVYLFNPFTIFISSIWGMFDSLAIFFALLGFYLFTHKKFCLSSLVWGLGVKWYSLGFVPFLSIYSYLQNREERLTRRLGKSVLILFIGFGFFAFLMVFPHILRGDLSYLKQMLEFRVRVGGGGGDVVGLTTFSEATFLKAFEYLGYIRPIPNFFLLTFTPLYLILLALFFISLRKSLLEKTDTLSTFNTVLISVLLIFYLTFPQLTPQCILWVLPHLIFGYFIFGQRNVIPLILISLIPISYLDFSSFIVGFGVPYLTVPVQVLSPSPVYSPLNYVISASLIPIAFCFLLKLSSQKILSRISILCKNLLSGLHIFDLRIFYVTVTAFMLLITLLVNNMKIRSPFILPILILTTLLQSIAFVAIEGERMRKQPKS